MTASDSSSTSLGGNDLASDSSAKVIQELMAENARLREEMAQVRQQSHAATHFMAGISHEIRTPMNGVLGMLELALRTRLNTEQEEYIVTARESAVTLLSLLNDVLDYSKIQAHKMVLERIHFSLAETVTAVLKLLGSKAYEKNLNLICNIHPDVRGFYSGDPARIRQILTNLVGNAIKFTESGEVEVEVRKVKEQGTISVIEFIIRDTGIGIPQEKVKTIFEPFSQAESSISRRFGGTGLGLSICRSLVELLGGHLEVQSKEGIGSTFSFILPVLKEGTLQCFDTLIAQRSRLTTEQFILYQPHHRQGDILCRDLQAQGISVSYISSLDDLSSVYGTIAILDVSTMLISSVQEACDSFTRTNADQAKIVLLAQPQEVASLSSLSKENIITLIKPVTVDDLTRVLLKGESTNDHDKVQDSTEKIASKEPALSILLAEDEKVNQKLMIRILEKEGHKVTLASNGKEAIEALTRAGYFNSHEKAPFDLILMDIQMPELNGIEATQQIRSQESGKRIPIIALTAHAMHEHKDEGIKAGMDDYVTKPIDTQHLLQTINTLTHRRVYSYNSLPAERKREMILERVDYDLTLLLDIISELYGRLNTIYSQPNSEKLSQVYVLEATLSQIMQTFDIQELLRKSANNAEEMKKVYRSFSRVQEEVSATVQLLIEEVDEKTLHNLSHTLRPMLIDMSAKQALKILDSIEQSVKESNLQKARSECAHLLRELQLLQPVLSMMTGELNQDPFSFLS